MNNDGAVTGSQLSAILNTSPDSQVRIQFAGMQIPVTGARYTHEGDQLVLEVSSLWAPSEWFLEQPEHRPHKKRPQPDPGSP